MFLLFIISKKTVNPFVINLANKTIDYFLTSIILEELLDSFIN